MENNHALINEIVQSFQNSFNTYIQDVRFQYNQKIELNNINDFPKINFYLTNIKTGIVLNLEYRFEYLVFFRIKNINNNCFRFDSYLTFKGYEKENLLSLYYLDGKDIPEKFKTYCDYVVRILNTDLKNVVEGKEWIDLPNDWMGYK